MAGPFPDGFHPMSGAGSLVGTGVDLTDNSHIDPKCSVADFTADKFYEYVATAEMIYVLATDEDARKQLFEELRGSALGRYLGAPRGDAIHHTYHFLKEKWFGDPEKAEEHRQQGQEAVDEWGAAQDNLLASIADSLMNLYNEFRRRFEDCGLFYGFSTMAIDGVFTLGELAIGAGIAGVTAKTLKSLKFVLSRSDIGAMVVTVFAEGGGKLTRTFSKSDLEAKYGKPEDSHFGTLEPDPNRPVGSTKAGKETDASERGKVSNTTGQDGEDYYKDKHGGRSLQNNSSHGIDHIDDSGSPIVISEIKTSTGSDFRLRGHELLGGEKFVEQRLSEMADGRGRYQGLSQADKDYAGELRDRIRSGESVEYRVVKLHKDKDGNIIEKGSEPWVEDRAAYIKWRQQQIAAKKRRTERKAAKEASESNPPTGPPNASD